MLFRLQWGEHRGRYWLDAARYGDTHGIHIDNYREIWAYREWVINAFNSNQKFDQFTIEQLAGDLLPNPTLEQRIATGYGRNHVINSEGGIIDEEYRVEYVADRVRTLGMSWIGLTLECSRCHDHKYDPLTQRDYYRFYAFFNASEDKGFYEETPGNTGPLVTLPTYENQMKLSEFDATLTAAQALVLTVFGLTGIDDRMNLFNAVQQWMAKKHDEGQVVVAPAPSPAKGRKKGERG